MATVSYTVQTRIREMINDRLQDTNGDATDDDLRSMLSDEQIEEFIIQNIREQASGYVFQRLNSTSNYYKYFTLDAQQHFFDASFTGEVGVDYEIHSNGYIKVTGGSPTATSYTVTASVVHVGYVLYDIFMFLANHRCQEVNTMVYNGEFKNIEQTYNSLVKQAHLCRGAYSI